MRAGSSTGCRLLAGVLVIALCCCSALAAQAAAQDSTTSSSSGRGLQQASVASQLSMTSQQASEPAGSKTGSGSGSSNKKPKSLSAGEVMAIAASTGALLPSCVPKYVTDLVIPPPMPVSTQPLTEVVSRRDRRAGRVLLAEPTAATPAGSVAALPATTTTTTATNAAAGTDQRRMPLPGLMPPGGPEGEFDVRPRGRPEGPDGPPQQRPDPRAEARSNGLMLAPQELERHQRSMRDPEEGRPAVRQEVIVKPVKKPREVYDLDDDYWGAIYNEPKSSKAAKADKKKASGIKQAAPAPTASPSPAPLPSPSPSPLPAPAPVPQAATTPLPEGVEAVPAYTGYDISARQITQDVLPQAPNAPNALPGCPSVFKQTELLAYGPANVPGTPFHNWPAYTIEAQHSVETRVRWTNDLIDGSGNFIPHLLKEAIDQTLLWANPGAVGGDTDLSPCGACKKAGNCETDQHCMISALTTYNGPVPLVTHLHGQNNINDFSNGYPEAWTLPKAKNLLAFKNVGSWYQTFKREYASATGNRWNQGSFTAIYKNSERPSPQWFHDNTLGITRLNVYAGLSGFYFVRERFPSLANGPELPGLPYPAYDGTIDPMLVRELPLAIQDRAFTNESQLWYPVADHIGNESLPTGKVSPRSLPEFSATVTANGMPVNMVMMTVNGRTYPRQAVHPDAYRLRILNACNTRTMQLRFARSTKPQINPLSIIDMTPLLPFYVVGNEGGFFPQVQPPTSTLQIGPGERYDLVLDFSSVMPGEYVFLLNNGPEPDTALYDGSNNGVGLTEHTAQVMRFDVLPLPADVKARPFTSDEQCALNSAMKAHWEATARPIDRAAPFNIRRLTLLGNTTPDGTPVVLQMGTANANTATATPWAETVATGAPLNTTQYWDIINLTPDAVPIHLHNTDFRFVGRWAVDVAEASSGHTAFDDSGMPVTNPDLDPLLQVQCSFDPSARCAVPRDTMLVLPNARTRIAFNGPTTSGLFAWSSQVLEAQDNEMMAPYCFGTPAYVDARRPQQMMCPGTMSV